MSTENLIKVSGTTVLKTVPPVVISIPALKARLEEKRTLQTTLENLDTALLNPFALKLVAKEIADLEKEIADCDLAPQTQDQALIDEYAG